MVWIAIILLFTKYYFELYLLVINLSYSLKKEHSIPTILQDIISQEKFEKSKSYLQDNTNLSLTQKAVNFVITLIMLFWLVPVFEKWAQSLTNHYIWQGLIFFGCLFLLTFLLGIPFSLYESFILENKYGFNKMTIKTFLIDLVKNLVITAILGSILLWAVLWAIQSPAWWWRFSLILLVFFFFSLWIGPVLLMPLFNKFTPLEENELKEIIRQFSKDNKIPIRKIFVMDASKRSSHGNAFFTGIGPTQRLVLYDTILSYPHEEILSIIGHEWGHWKHYDIWRQLSWLLILETGFFFLANQLFASGWIQHYFHVSTLYAILVYTIIFLTPLLFFIEPILSYLTRKQEFSADRYSAILLGKTEPGMQSLKRLIRDNLSNLHPHYLYKIWYYSHPAPEERILALKNIVSSQKSDK